RHRPIPACQGRLLRPVRGGRGELEIGFTTRHVTTRHDTAQHYTTQHSIYFGTEGPKQPPHYSTLLHRTSRHCTALHNTAQHSIYEDDMEAKTATIAQKSIDAQIIERHLETAEVGQLVTYVELSQLVGRDVQKKDRHLLETAKRALLRRGMVFEAVRGEGVKRVTDDENITNRQRDFAHIR